MISRWTLSPIAVRDLAEAMGRREALDRVAQDRVYAARCGHGADAHFSGCSPAVAADCRAVVAAILVVCIDAAAAEWRGGDGLL
jgi:hypothetical protein